MNWLPEAASSFAGRVDNLIWFVTIISLVSFLLVTVLLIYFSIKYRRKAEGEDTPYQTGNRALEVVWTIIPSILVLFIFGYGVAVYDNMRVPPKDAIEVNVLAKQWVWQFQYGNGKRTLNELYVPEGVPVKLVMTSDDVLHSFFVPAFRTKQDVVPGTYTYLWFDAIHKGEYDIFCAEYCGTSHSAMLGKVKVLSREDYDKWYAGGGAPEVAAESGLTPAERGAELYNKRGCKACHTLDGSHGVGPTFKGVFGRTEELQDGSHITVDENYIIESLHEPQAKMVKGYPPVMPSFKGMISDREVSDIIAYLKTIK